MRYYVITYGCQMNKSDSERIAAVLKKQGHKPVGADSSDEALAKADLIVVNMCSVRQSHVDRIYGLSPKFKKLKTENRKLKTVLTGCILKKDRAKFRRIFDEIWDKPEKISIPSKFIPISNGCNNFCAYCVVPYARGPLVCRSHKEILKEAASAAKKGVKEIWLLGQNVNDYRDRAKNGKAKTINFPKLIGLIDKIPGSFRFFFISPHPKNFSDELINTLSKCKKFGKRLNLPVQSGDNQILKKMNRPYTVEQYKKLVKKIRKKIPGINLSTDVIVGFPGESKKQFANTAKLFKELKFNIAYIAKYSPRPGTAAFKLKDDVPFKEKKQREKCLRKLLSS